MPKSKSTPPPQMKKKKGRTQLKNHRGTTLDNQKHGSTAVKKTYIRQIFGGSTPPKYLTDIHPSNIWGVYTPKYLTDIHPSNIWGVYTPKIFDGCMSVKYLTHVHASVI